MATEGESRDKDTVKKAPKGSRGRPATHTSPDPIPDTPENVAKVIMQRPPKKEWEFLKKEDPTGI